MEGKEHSVSTRRAPSAYCRTGAPSGVSCFALVLGLFAVSGAGEAYEWPFKGATATQQTIRSNGGTFRQAGVEGGPRQSFHSGIDIVPKDQTDLVVYAVEDGENMTGIEDDGKNYEGIRIGRINYIHLVVYPEYADGGSMGKGVKVSKGAPIGVLKPIGVDGAGNPITKHVHFMQYSGPNGYQLNPLEHMETFTDNTKPIVHSFRIFGDPGWPRAGCVENCSADCLSSNEFAGSSVLYGKLDFLVRGEDHLNPGDALEQADEYGMMTPLRIGYKILPQTGSIPLLDRFSYSPTGSFHKIPSIIGDSCSMDSPIRIIHWSMRPTAPEDLGT